MSLVQLAYGKPDSLVVYLDFSRVAAKGLVDDAYQVAAMQSAWRLLGALGLIHLTTVWPGIPRATDGAGHLPRPMKPGEYFTVEAVEDTSVGAVPGFPAPGGYTLNVFERNLDPWQGCRAIVRVTDANPILWGTRAVHECGHGLLFNSVRGENGHTDDPMNFMYGGPGPLDQGATMTPTQVGRAASQVTLVHQMHRRFDGRRQQYAPVDF